MSKRLCSMEDDEREIGRAPVLHQVSMQTIFQLIDINQLHVVDIIYKLSLTFKAT